ncbi:MAG: hypothetical protein EOM21_16010 [Gammaproteobacteria bacterium]|nr:hypothetical protein [Gammaproteobacteria bacterium]
MTNQPVWKVIHNLGDATPLEYGGAFLLVDETGVYAPELIVWDEPTMNGVPISNLYSTDAEDVAARMGWELYNRIDSYGSGETIFLYRKPDGIARIETDCADWEELLEREGVDPEPQYTVYRFSVERLYRVEDEDRIYFITKTIKEGFENGTLPHPISTYKEWYLKGIEPTDLSGLLEDSPIQNALATLNLANYHGFHEFDSYPLKMGKRELIRWARQALPGADL